MKAFFRAGWFQKSSDFSSHVFDLPSKELTCPTLRKRTVIFKSAQGWDMLVNLMTETIQYDDPIWVAMIQFDDSYFFFWLNVSIQLVI